MGGQHCVPAQLPKTSQRSHFNDMRFLLLSAVGCDSEYGAGPGPALPPTLAIINKTHPGALRRFYARATLATLALPLLSITPPHGPTTPTTSTFIYTLQQGSYRNTHFLIARFTLSWHPSQTEPV